MYKLFVWVVIFLCVHKFDVLSQSEIQNSDTIYYEKSIIMLGVKHFENPFIIIFDSYTANQLIGEENILLHPHSMVLEYPNDIDSLISNPSILFSTKHYLYYFSLFPSFIREFVLPNLDSTFEFHILERSYPNYFNRFWSMENNLKWEKSHSLRYAKSPHKDFLIILVSSNLLYEHVKTISTDPVVPIMHHPNHITYYKMAIPILIDTQ